MLPKKEWIENNQTKIKKLVEPDIVFDERKYIQTLLKTQYTPKQYHLNLLACYYVEKGKDFAFIQKRLMEMVKKRVIKKAADYNAPMNKWEQMIIAALRYSQVNKLKDKTIIHLSKTEMDLIMSQDTIKKQNVLFVIACLAKFDKAQIKVEDHRKNYAVLDFYKTKLNEKILRNFLEFKSTRQILDEFKRKGYIKLIKNAVYRVDFIEKVDEKDSILTVVCDYSLVQYLNKYAKKMG